MEKVRIGNDMRVNFSVYRNGEPESFDGASNIVTKLVNEAYNKLITHTYTIAGNIVQFDIDALQLTQCGKCRLFISYTKGGDYTVDSPAFELVNYTDQAGGTEIIGVEIVSINISGDIGINRDGLSAYEVWESYPGNEGKTIEQYFTWLRENPTKIDLDGLNSNIDKLHFNPDTLVQLTSIGDVRYSTESRTLEVKVSDTVSIQLGQEMQTRVKNNAGAQINNGQMVYIDSAAGANPLAKIASTSNAEIAQRTFGMATENIANNGFGAITTEGLVRDINTAAFQEGEMLWLGTNGSVTNIEPVAPTPKISVGMVLRSNTNNGVIYVKIRAIARNQKLSDVYAPTLTTGDVLRWNSTTLRFEVYNLSNKADLVAGKIPASQLPAYVDDILEYANLAAFPLVGETSKLYVTLDTNLTYRWSGSAYTEVSKSLAIGITNTTAFRGDWGKIAYDHSQLTNSNPHGTTAAQIANTPAGTISATTVQAAINELDADRVQLETDLNLLIGIESETNFDFLSYFTTINSGIFALDNRDYGSVWETAAWYRTDYLDVSSADEVEYFGGANANSFGIAFYDSNKNPIKPNPFSLDYRASSITKTLPVPSGAFYFRASGKNGAYVKYITKMSGLLDDLDKRIDNIDQSILNITSNSQMPDVYGIEIANTHPPKLLKSGPTFLSIIKNWGFIGDSFSSGEFEYIDSDGVTVKYMDWYDYSFGQFLMRINGTSGYNYSIGGMTAKTWCTTSGERTWNNGTGKILELKNAYVIQLGPNDTNTDILVGNLSTDVDIDDYTNNSDTFAGWICGVIQRIKSINPKAIFFIATVRYTSESIKRLEFSALIREIPSILSNTYVIDLEKYGPKWLDEDAVSKFISGAHPSAAGHYYQALVYNTLIDWEIRKNLNNFTKIQFVGTDYYR